MICAKRDFKREMPEGLLIWERKGMEARRIDDTTNEAPCILVASGGAGFHAGERREKSRKLWLFHHLQVS